MIARNQQVGRREFLKTAGVVGVGPLIVPRHVLGGKASVAPSDTFGGALIGCGGRGGGTYCRHVQGLEVRQLAKCDVRFVGQADDKNIYTDFRRVLDRKDIDLVAIATPPHWHALISIAAMEAGKDVMCEKPLTRFIGEGRAVVEAVKRYGRILQVCTFGRFGASKSKDNILTHKIMRSGLLKECQGVYIKKGGFKVREWSGKPDLKPSAVAEEPRLGHVLRPVAAEAVRPRALRRHAPLLLGLRGRRPQRHGPALLRPGAVDVRQGRHEPGRDRGVRPAGPPGGDRHVGLGRAEVRRRADVRARQRRVGQAVRPQGSRGTSVSRTSPRTTRRRCWRCRIRSRC